MAIIGIDSVTYGSDDLEKSRSLFLDWGLTEVDANPSQVILHTGIGSRVILMHESNPDLPARMSGGSNFREVIWGVETQAELDALGAEIACNREISTSEDGTVRTVDDGGVNVGFRVWVHGAETAQAATQFNMPGSRTRVDEVAKFHERARPWRMGHIVFFVPDVEVAENFYLRLGFHVSDRYSGGAAVFLRNALRSDHHNMLFIKSRGGTTDIHHVAFEVNDIHEVFGGGLGFSRKGWPTDVGPGRHPISSAYFWYFKNPLGGSIEYFSDPDFVTERWTPRSFDENRFSEWHLVDGIHPANDGRVRPSLAVAVSGGIPVKSAGV